MLVLPAAARQQGSALAEGRVSGIVTDVHGAWITGVSVTIQTQSASYRTETDENGFYSAWLPPGTYTLRVDKTGFCAIRRGEFVVSSGSQIRFNLQLWLGPTDSYGRANYSELADANKQGPAPLVFYGQRTTNDNLLTFTGPDFNGSTPDYPAVLTFDRFTFIADRFTYNRAQKFVFADGHVSWYKDSAKPSRASQIRIFFMGTIPQVKILDN
ncbi:MAG TPA: carboxypeptidase-like regulatory domain-containing protein [Candidatus Acidoferrales bacterium]|nr:carboxypeptidase-like regulatory domain-containing protein [Candidatus Acidoferrales bacterium]